MSRGSPYRGLGPAAPPRPRLTHYYCPQFRVWLAPIAWLLGIVILRGAWSDDFSANYHHSLWVTSSVRRSDHTVVFAQCSEGGNVPIPCARAPEVLFTMTHPGLFVRNVRARVRGEWFGPDEAARRLAYVLPSRAPEQNPSSYSDAVEQRHIGIDIMGDNVGFPVLYSLIAMVMMLSSLPSRIVRVRLDPATGMLLGRDYGVWRRPRTSDCLLAEVNEVLIDGGLVLVKRDGSVLPLTSTDGRPIELQRWSCRRLNAWLEDLRAV